MYFQIIVTLLVVSLTGVLSQDIAGNYVYKIIKTEIHLIRASA